MSKKIEGYLSQTTGPTSTPQAELSWDVVLAHSVLRSCHALFTELENTTLDAMSGLTAKAICGTQWQDTETHVDAMLTALQLAKEKRGERRRLLSASRQTIGSLRACVQTLAASPHVGSPEAMETAARALAAVALQAASMSEGESAPENRSSAKETAQLPEAASEPGPETAPDLPIANALLVAGKLVEQLRIFTRVSQQSWADTKSQLAKAPLVPSPLASRRTSSSSGSDFAANHRRWASEDLDGCEAATQSPSRSLAPMPAALHARNRSDSRLQTQQRPKHVRFLTRPLQPSPSPSPSPLPSGTAPPEPAAATAAASAIDQTHLAELSQALSVFEKAIARLAPAGPEQPRSHDPAAVRALATAFVQLSRLASSTSMMRHFDRPTLALFKATTHAVKLLVPQKSQK
ncbi:hypothetical protein GGI07_004205 [Coemansia sp. Benny D115]|nr:hypothetical protein GGI07_004205 [Coemansia sp. Benny D115]